MRNLFVYPHVHVVPSTSCDPDSSNTIPLASTTYRSDHTSHVVGTDEVLPYVVSDTYRSDPDSSNTIPSSSWWRALPYVVSDEVLPHPAGEVVGVLLGDAAGQKPRAGERRGRPHDDDRCDEVAVHQRAGGLIHILN